MILIVSNTEDQTCTYLCSKIAKPYFRFDTDHFLSRYSINVSKNGWNLKDRIKNLTITDKSYKGAIYRRPINPKISLSDAKKELSDDLSVEARVLYESFLNSKCSNWLNEPHNIRKAESKLLQLHMACRSGFMVPDYLVTNDKKAGFSFKANHSAICVKPFYFGIFEYNDELFIPYTSLVKDEDLKKLNCFPVILQEYIEKIYELRITIVGNKLFPIRINSQNNEYTKYDWRINNCMSVNYEPIVIQNDLSGKCLRLNKIFGLNFSAMDIIVDKHNNHYFLDLNPNGQWAWLDEMFQLGISEAIGDFLWNQQRNG